MIRRLPNLVARSLSAEISEKVHPPRNMISLHFDPGDSFVLESKENENKLKQVLVQSSKKIRNKEKLISRFTNQQNILHHPPNYKLNHY